MRFVLIIRIIFQVSFSCRYWNCRNQPCAKGHFALYNCLVLGYIKYNGVQRVYAICFQTKVSWQSSLGSRHDSAPGHLTLEASLCLQMQCAKVLIFCFTASAETDT